ncbi:MAG: metallophosphoesterase [Prevotella sp.]|nr:metallophosphoesterase [Prevotella sp.]
MNYLWIVIFMALPILGIGYTFSHLWQLLPLPAMYKYVILGVLGAFVFSFFANFGLFRLDHWPMPLATATYQIGSSSLIILLYAVLLFLLLDLGHLVHLVPTTFLHHSWKGTLTVAAILLGTFTYAYFHYMDKVRQPIEMHTQKAVDKPMTIVMVSDLHVGYLNQVDELNRWVDLINHEKPDLILIGGDIIDGHVRPLREENMAASFRRLKAPVVACLGNHEYYGGMQGTYDFYKEAGITLLRDQSVTVKGLNIIGRDDRTNPHRKPLAELMKGIDLSKYTILLDHQPYHLEEAEHAGIDFEFSGHTHRGQLWPMSWITDAVYEDSFGPLQKSGTQYYVSSGIGIWGGKFRIGTRSEYVVATLSNP